LERGYYSQTSSGLASTIPIAMHVFGKKEAAVNQPYNVVL
jgi:hypothetical protein